MMKMASKVDGLPDEHVGGCGRTTWKMNRLCRKSQGPLSGLLRTKIRVM